jgi:predicted peptidase
LPASYEASENPWPLIVFLHGSSERGSDPRPLRGSSIFSLARDGAGVPAIIAVPQCLPEHFWQSESVAAFIEHLASTYRVDGQRIYLVGYSMGGHGTWATAQTKPEMFAAIVPICGGGDPNRAASLASVPIWAFHGVRDNVIPVVATKQMIDAIQAAGGQPRLTLLPDGDHGICDEVCRREDLWEWLLQQNRSNASSPSTSVGKSTAPDS